MSNIKKLLGENIKFLRKAKNISRKELADLMQINIRQLARIENGASFPSDVILENLAHFLQVQHSQLFNFDLASAAIEYHEAIVHPHCVVRKVGDIYTILSVSKNAKRACPTKNKVVTHPEKLFQELSIKVKSPIFVEYFEHDTIYKREIYYPNGRSLPVKKSDSENSYHMNMLLSDVKDCVQDKQKMEIILLALQTLKDINNLPKFKEAVYKIEL